MGTSNLMNFEAELSMKARYLVWCQNRDTELSIPTDHFVAENQRYDWPPSKPDNRSNIRLRLVKPESRSLNIHQT